MQVVLRGHPVGAGGEAERRVLDALQILDRRGPDVAGPNWSGEIDLRTDEGLEGVDQRRLVLTPSRPSQGLQHLQPSGSG